MLLTTWTKGTISSRPGARYCSKCGKRFIDEEEDFSIRETRVSRFRGDDEVEFFCFDCTPKSNRKILKLRR